MPRGDFLVNAYVDWQIAFCLQSWLGEGLGCFHVEAMLLLLLGVKRTEWGKLASNSKPVCDLTSRCSNSAINIKHGFGMGFQLGLVGPHPGAQQPHPSPSRRAGLLSGQPRLTSLLSLPSFSLLPLITLIADWGGGEKSLKISICL